MAFAKQGHDRVDFFECTSVGPACLGNAPIAALWEYWQRKLGAQAVLHKSEIDPIELRFGLGQLVMVERMADGDFCYRLFGTTISELIGFDMTGRRVSEYSGPVAEYHLVSYQRCLNLGRPMYTLHRPQTLGSGRIWERLLLPLCGEDDNLRYVMAMVLPVKKPQDMAGRLNQWMVGIA